MNPMTIYDADDDDILRATIGRRIVATTEDTLTLDDGTVLEIEGVSDCCAWYDGSVRHLAYTDNIITNVRQDDHPNSSAVDAYSIVIIASGIDVAAIDIEGDPASGYYCHSVTLKVKTKD